MLRSLASRSTRMSLAWSISYLRLIEISLLYSFFHIPTLSGDDLHARSLIGCLVSPPPPHRWPRPVCEINTRLTVTSTYKVKHAERKWRVLRSRNPNLCSLLCYLVLGSSCSNVCFCCCRRFWIGLFRWIACRSRSQLFFFFSDCEKSWLWDPANQKKEGQQRLWTFHFSWIKENKNTHICKNGHFGYCWILSWSFRIHYRRHGIYGQSSRRETSTMLSRCQNTLPFDETQSG